MSKIFITGTDTNIGKTIASSWLCHHLKADYFKPIQSGISNNFPYTDSDFIRSLNLEYTQVYNEIYKFKHSLSPHLAAQKENICINLNTIILPKTNKPLIVEGAGGIYVPLNDKQFILDLIIKLNLAVIVVAKSQLGTINHTCLTLKVLQQNGVKVLGVIMIGHANLENKQAIEHFTKVPVILELPIFNQNNNWQDLKMYNQNLKLSNVYI